MTDPVRRDAATGNRKFRPLRTGVGILASALLTAMRGLQNRQGWQRYGWAFGGGVAAALAQAPFSLLPVLFLAYGGLLLLLDGAARTPRAMRVGFLTGWAFGFGFYLVGIYWVGFSFLVEADRFGWMLPFAIPAFCGFLGLFVAIPAAITARAEGRSWERVAIFAAVFAVSEFLRGHVLTGFPWNLPAQALIAFPLLAQSLALVGPYALSFLVILLAALPAASVDRDGNLIGGRPGAAALAGIGLLVLLGAVRFAGAEASPDSKPTPLVVIVQPNVPQRDKLDPDLRRGHFARTVGLTEEAVRADTPAIVIWPENTFPFLDSDPTAPAFFADALPADTALLTGTFRSYRDDSGHTVYGNGAVVFDGNDTNAAIATKPLTGIYDKHHLVPFGEYLPFRAFLTKTGLSQLAPVEDGFTPGPGPAVLTAQGVRFAPLICYEDVFPNELYPRSDRPDFLAVMTNDAWFGDDAGPKQHLAISRMRAIESGLPMARSANTGISAVIDPYGRILAALPLYEAGSIVRPIPRRLPPTLYARLQEWPFLALIFGAFLLGFRRHLAR